MQPYAVIDDSRLQGRLRRLGTEAPRVLRKARNEAGRALRTRAKRDVGALLNLPASRIASTMKLSYTPTAAVFSVRYAPTPAHYFRGWTYRAVVGRPIQYSGLSERGVSRALRGREVTTIRGSGRGERARTSRLTRRTYGDRGLTVRFFRNESARRYPRAFRTPSVGHGRVFIQRQGPPRKPLEPINGPSVWSQVLPKLAAYERFGYGKLFQRMQFWANREANRV